MPIASLLREDGDAASEAVEVAQLAAPAAVVESVDVFDEMADDVPRVPVGDRVVAGALTWIPVAVALRGPAGDVERAERRDEDVEDTGVSGREIGERAPVVRRGADARLLVAENAEVQPPRHLVRGVPRLDRRARPRLRGGPQSRSRRRAHGARVGRILGPASERQLLPEVGVVRVAVE